MSDKKYDYFSKPDGEDVLNKFQALFKPTAVTALGVATVDVLLWSHPKGYVKTLGRYAYITAPFFGAMSAFVLGSNMVGSARGKDDKLNWAVGGAAAGAMVGVWKRHPETAFVMAGILGFSAWFKKYCHEKGYVLIPTEHKYYSGYKAHTYDFTLTKPIKGNWTTGKEE